MIPQRELDQIREDAESYLQSTCDVSRSTRVSDGGGSYSDSWATVLTDVPCRLNFQNYQAPATSGGRLNEDAAHYFWVPVGVDVRLQDRLIHEGRTWEVTGAPHRTSFDQFIQKLTVVQVDRAQ